VVQLRVQKTAQKGSGKSEARILKYPAELLHWKDSARETGAFIYGVYKFYAVCLLPMQLNVTQIVRFMVMSGLFTFGNSKLYCSWTVTGNLDIATIEQISTILYG